MKKYIYILFLTIVVLFLIIIKYYKNAEKTIKYEYHFIINGDKNTISIYDRNDKFLSEIPLQDTLKNILEKDNL